MKRVLFLCALVLFLARCNESPVGQDELDSRGNFDTQELELRRYNTLTEFNKFYALGSSYNLSIGKNSEYEARILLKFTFPDTTYTGLDEIKLILHTNTQFSNDTIAFSVHTVFNEFTEDDANWFQRTSSEWWDSAGGDYSTTVLREVSVNGDSIVVNFNYSDFEEIQDAEGIILIPQDTGFIYFNAKESGDAPVFVIIKNEDQTTFSLTDDCSIVTGPEPFYIENWIGSGRPFRNYAKFIFDSLLLEKKAIFVELSFSIEDRFVYRDSIEIGVKELLEPIDDFDTPTGSYIALDRFASSDSVIKIDIVQHIQHLIEHPDSNFGFFIILSPENYDIANFRIRDGSHKLVVGYIDPPQER